MKQIMISIQPKWVVKILNGEKTLEIRKTMPKCDLPIDVYIYCTKGKETLFRNNFYQLFKIENSKYMYSYGDEILNGEVVAKFTLNKVDSLKGDFREDEYLTRIGCISWEDLHKYFKGGQTRYAWHIDNLEIFDKPKELSEFKSYKKNIVNTKINRMVFETELDNSLTKAPQSWCYVEVLK